MRPWFAHADFPTLSGDVMVNPRSYERLAYSGMVFKGNLKMIDSSNSESHDI